MAQRNQLRTRTSAVPGSVFQKKPLPALGGKRLGKNQFVGDDQFSPKWIVTRKPYICGSPTEAVSRPANCATPGTQV